MKEYKISGINGPVITIKNAKDLSVSEMVHVGDMRLVGEVIGVNEKCATIQVYEQTTGLKVGQSVYASGTPLSVLLGPGLLTNIFDGTLRPLKEMAKDGAFIKRGSNLDSLDKDKLWDVSVCVKEGDYLSGGSIYAEVKETSLITHKCMVEPHLSGKIIEVKPNGKHKIFDTVARLQDDKGKVHELTLCQRWPIRHPRPFKERVAIDRPLLTGQRIIDTLFPIAKGGAAAIPGGFGTGKSMTQVQLAKWSDADIVIYVGCGERGNEITQLLEEFTVLIDPKTQKPLMDRTIIIANTSNMPVAAREASIYTGITLAEYYRDMGYDVAIMADSTSRWAEALREISGRLEEMPAEEGFPAYLPSRLSQFYERAGYVVNSNGSEGSISIIAAVSPQGSDFSEPVTQNTKRFVRTFWALDKSLAYARHYPAINWIDSYSEYTKDLEQWYNKNVGKKFLQYRTWFISMLNQESKLMEIVKLIGSDVLPDDQKLIIEICRVIRVGFLQQNAFHKDDTYVLVEKQMKMMEAIIHLYNKSKEVIESATPISKILSTDIFEKAIKMKYDIPNDRLELFDEYIEHINSVTKSVVEQNKPKY